MPSSCPDIVNTKTLAKFLAGGDDYIRTNNNIVRGLALKRDLNPDAPEVVVYGNGPRVVARAELFRSSGVTVPAYIRRKTDVWQYLGQYRAVEITTDPIELEYYGRTRKPGVVAGALVLERVDVENILVRGGRFPDAKTRREIENAAVQFVIKHLKAKGFEIQDLQHENRGYDLLVTSGSSRVYVEVKGTDAVRPRFFLTRNENSFGANNADWQLFVVCEARRTPCLYQFNHQEVTARFLMDPLAWECTESDA